MNRYYYLHNGAIWSTLMSEGKARQRNAVKAKDDEDALNKLLPSMIAQIYNKMFHDPTLDTYLLDVK